MPPTNPELNVAALEELERSHGWALVQSALTAELEKTVGVLPAQSLEQIGMAALTRQQSRFDFTWVRDVLVRQLIEQERAAIREREAGEV